MRRLIYTSRSLVPPSEIDQIMASSLRNNDHVGVTGMLWAWDDWFAQVLEGDFEQVSATMRRIRADPRHTDIEVLLDREVMCRQFGSWSMREADDGEATAFMVGFARCERSNGAQRLYDIVVSSLGR